MATACLVSATRWATPALAASTDASANRSMARLTRNSCFRWWITASFCSTSANRSGASISTRTSPARTASPISLGTVRTTPDARARNPAW